MTRAGQAALAGMAVLLGLGIWLRWAALDLLGVGLALALLLGLAVVLRPSRLALQRAIQPSRVSKGSPAVAVLTVANRGHRPIPTTVASQPFGTDSVHTVLPRLRRGEQGVRTYRLPTYRRGVIDVGPVEVTRRDPFELFRASHRYGETERIWVYPRVLPLRPLPTGRTRLVEGPSSDSSPQGSITFHRLREYTPGDDLRLVHWRSSARAGHLVVRHNVDTAQPYSVVLLDLRPSRYGTPEAFEEAVDVAASVVTAGASMRAPVQLRLTDGAVLGGGRLSDPAPLLDHLTAVHTDTAGSLQTQLNALRRARGGTSLTVITGAPDPADLPWVAQLRPRFGRLVVIGVTAQVVTISVPGVRVITASDAAGVAAAWNART